MQLLFRVPKNQQVVLELVRSIPDDWAWIGGRLNARAEALRSGNVAVGTGFLVSSFPTKFPLVGDAAPAGDSYLKPDLLAILGKGRQPSFVQFDMVGYATSGVPFSVARDIALARLEQNYWGTLRFYSGAYRDFVDQPPAVCSVRIRNSSETTPHELSVVWTPEFGGTKQLVAPILDVCTQFALHQEREPD